MGARRIRREQIRHDQGVSRRVNGVRKVKERARRQARLLELVRNGKFPYTPTVMSWLSVALDTPATRITPEAVQQYLAAQKA